MLNAQRGDAMARLHSTPLSSMCTGRGTKSEPHGTHRARAAERATAVRCTYTSLVRAAAAVSSRVTAVSPPCHHRVTTAPRRTLSARRRSASRQRTYTFRGQRRGGGTRVREGSEKWPGTRVRELALGPGSEN